LARAVQPRLISEYVEPGLVSLQFRDYAFRGPEAERAAEAAACAAEQDAFWLYHDTLFLNQRRPGSFMDARLKQMAEALGLEMAAFTTCLDSGKKREQVQQSLEDGRAQGIDSTPRLFVNGTEISDWHDWAAVEQAIEDALAKVATPGP
jgi:protein-disulfide isomerase